MRVNLVQAFLQILKYFEVELRKPGERKIDMKNQNP